DSIILQAAGNPLFLIGLAGLDPAEGTTLPSSVISLVQQQLDQMPPDVCAACYRAAILGQSFSNVAFDAIFPGIQRGGLARSGFFRLRSDGTEFSHARIHEAIYAVVPPEIRRGLHRLAAEYFRSRDPVLWAEHALCVADDKETAQACFEASEYLLPRYRREAGRRFVEAGLRCDINPDMRARFTFSLGSLARERGDFEAALAYYTEAFELADDADVKAQTALRRWSVLKYLDRMEEARSALGIAATFAEGAKVSLVTRSEIAQELGDEAFRRGDGASCLHYNEAAMEFARQGGHILQECRALGGLGDAYYAQLSPALAAEAFNASVALSQANDLMIASNAHMHMAALCAFFAEPAPNALEAAAAAVVQARMLGNPRNLVLALSIFGEIAAYLGDIDALDQSIAEVKTVVANDGTRFRADAHVLQVFQAWLGGDRALAAGLARQGLETEAGVYLGPEYAGLLAVLTDDDRERRRAIRTGETLLEQGSLSHCFAAFAFGAVRACLNAGWEREAAKLISTLSSRVKEAEFGLVRHAFDLARAELADDPKAKALAETAAEKAGLKLFLLAGL
ncbi:MAG: hypothetical protein AAFX00_07690, partial [Pseudomonadota bacterium]